MITVLLADDQIIVRNFIQFLLERADDIQVVALASNGQEALEKAALNCPNVVVMDISMPVMDGVEATRQLCADCPETRVLMTTSHDTPPDIRRSIQAGATGYLLKDVAVKELVPAVRSIHYGERYFSNRVAEIAKLYIEQQRLGFRDEGTRETPVGLGSTAPSETERNLALVPQDWRLQQVKPSREKDNMSETYNRKQAMERLGILSLNSFLFLQRKYPDAFVIVNQGAAADKKPLYDKDTLDNFARRREYFKQGAKGEHA